MKKEKPERILLHIEEAAETLALSRSTVYNLLNAGQLPFVRIGRSIRIPYDALKSWAAKQAALATLDADRATHFEDAVNEVSADTRAA